jgi:hypothetical protein
VALAQLEQVYLVRKNGAREDFSKALSSQMKGMFETSWMSPRQFIEAYYSRGDNRSAKANTDTFKALFAEIRKNSNHPAQ